MICSLLAPLMLAATLAGCGQKGPLYLPGGRDDGGQHAKPVDAEPADAGAVSPAPGAGGDTRAGQQTG